MKNQSDISVKSLTLADLANALGAELKGAPDHVVTGLATLESATASKLSFLANPAYESQLTSTKAGAVIVHPNQANLCPVSALVIDNPYLAYARASHFFDNAPQAAAVVHASASVDVSAVISNTASVGANAVIEAGVMIHDNVIIGPGCVVGANSVVGSHSRLHANVTLYHGVRIGEHCTLHSGAVIGGDGFGFASHEGKWQKIAQLGGVTIGNYVDVGVNTTIDRGAIDDTRIHDYVILDNQIQIAHNVEIGEGTAIAGCTGIAGSTTIGKHCTIAGAVGISGHLTICDGVHITMRSAITRSITEPGSYSSGTAMSKTQEWRKNAARFRQLDSIVKRIRAIERLGKKP